MTDQLNRPVRYRARRGQLPSLLKSPALECGASTSPRRGPVARRARRTPLARLRDIRRYIVKETGKRMIRSLAGFFAHQSLVEDRPVLDRAPFEAFLAPLEENWREIRGELAVVLANRENLPAFHEISPDQKRISRGGEWKTFVLFGFGERRQVTCSLCPATTRLLEQVPGLQTAFFSVLPPHYQIPEHAGITKSILRAHLGLIVPRQRRRCTMRVGNEAIVWREGECVVFDDTYRHSVTNDTDETRVVLLFDFDRPMRWPGRAVSKSFLWGLKRTAYFKDALRNQETWEKQFESATNQEGERPCLGNH